MHTLWLSINIQSYPVTYDLDFQSQASYGYDSFTNKNSFSKVNQFKRWKETDGRTNATDCFIFTADNIGKNSKH